MSEIQPTSTASMLSRLQSFVDAWQAMIDKNVKDNFPNLWAAAQASGIRYETVTVTEGKRYWKIVVRSAPYNGGSCRAFVDRNTGAIYKAASWAAPAKHSRGSILADDFGMSCMTPYGPNYLR